MSIITLEEFDQFVEEFPEMEQFYDFTLTTPPEDFYGDTCTD